MTTEPLKLGIIGLSRAFTIMLPTFTNDPRIKMVAAYDPRRDACAGFAEEFNAKAHESAEALCADGDVVAVYIASPHQFHLEHVTLAAKYKKHVMVEKPMALTVDECRAMIAAAHAANIKLVVGHSHSFDLPYLRARAMIDSGAYGEVRMINALNFTDFLYRPRRPEELDTSKGGGVVFSQAAHQVDVVRLLAGRKAMSVRAFTGSWDTSRPTEGAYSAQIKFEGGSFATLIYSGYAHFDSDELMGWWGELGESREGGASYGRARQNLQKAATPTEETALKTARAYASGRGTPHLAGERAHNHFGLVVVSCDHADLRTTPQGVMVYGDTKRYFDELPAPKILRAEVIDELYAAAMSGTPPLHSGEWGLATLEICLAVLEAAKTGREVTLKWQI